MKLANSVNIRLNEMSGSEHEKYIIVGSLSINVM